jgi:hypothetical protein
LLNWSRFSLPGVGPLAHDFSGRDDNSIAGVKYFSLKLLRAEQNCHPDRSVPGFPVSRHLPGPRVRFPVKETA